MWKYLGYVPQTLNIKYLQIEYSLQFHVYD
jgi:hypothetical protein